MFNNLLNLFFPKACSGCSSILLSNEFAICARCRHLVPLTLHHLDPQNEVYRKFYGKFQLEFAATFMYYHKEGITQNLIHNLKYKGQQDIGIAIGAWYGYELLENPILKEVHEIIPVPLHEKKLRERGYNQVTTFGTTLASVLQVPYNEKLLFRKRYSKTQTKKDRLNRIDINISDVFDVVYGEVNENKHYLLIDDVLTTGSTIEACANALLKIPGSRISVLCMAMSH